MVRKSVNYRSGLLAVCLLKTCVGKRGLSNTGYEYLERLVECCLPHVKMEHSLNLTMYVKSKLNFIY